MLSSMNVQSNEGIYGYRCCQCQHCLITLGRGARFCVNLYLFVCSHISETMQRNVTKFFPYCLWSVLARSSSWLIGGGRPPQPPPSKYATAVSKQTLHIGQNVASLSNCSVVVFISFISTDLISSEVSYSKCAVQQLSLPLM